MSLQGFVKKFANTSVATRAALSLVNDAALAMGDLGYVSEAGIDDYYTLDKDSVAAVDGTNVLATYSGTGRWLKGLGTGSTGDGILLVATVADLPAAATQQPNQYAYVESRRALYNAVDGAWYRLPGGHASWTTQAAWFIDASGGDDDNDGSTALTALATHAELEARLWDQALQQNTDITILGALPSTDPINIRYRTTEAVTDVRYLQGDADTIEASGVLTAPTAISRATNTPLSFNSSISLDAHVGKKLVRTGGAGTWNILYVGKIVVAGTTYRGSPAIALPTIPTAAPTVSTPVANDTFDVRTSPTIHLGIVTNISIMTTFTFNRFTIDFGSFVAVPGLAFLNFQECVQASGGTGPFFTQTSVCTFIGCKTASMSISSNASITLRNGLSLSGNVNVLANSAMLTMTGDQLMQAGAVSCDDKASVVINNAGFFDAPVQSIIARRGGTVRAVAGFYGSGAVTQLTLTNAQGWYTVIPTATGTTQDALIGGRARAFNATPAQIPWSETGPYGAQSYFVVAGSSTSQVTGLKNSAYTARFGEQVIVDPGPGAFALTLPPGSANFIGDSVEIWNTTASINAVTATASGADTIEGAATNVVSGAYFAVKYTLITATTWKVTAIV